MKEHFASPWKFGFRGGSELCDVIFQGVLLFVTKCDEGEGVQNRPKLRDVIYGRPLRLGYSFEMIRIVGTAQWQRVNTYNTLPANG